MNIALKVTVSLIVLCAIVWGIGEGIQFFTETWSWIGWIMYIVVLISISIACAVKSFGKAVIGD